MHPEAGHLCLKRMAGDDFPGVDTVFGGPSVEGLASTVALATRKASLLRSFLRPLTNAAAAADDGDKSGKLFSIYDISDVLRGLCFRRFTAPPGVLDAPLHV